MKNNEILEIILNYYVELDCVNRKKMIDIPYFMDNHYQSALHIEKIALQNPKSLLGQRYKNLMELHPEMHTLKQENPFIFFKLMIYYNISILSRNLNFQFDFLKPFFKKYFEVQKKYGSLYKFSEKIILEENKDAQKKLNDFLNQNISKPIISKDKKDETICPEETSLVFNYDKLTCQIESAYGFNTRGFFEKQGTIIPKKYFEDLGFNKKEIPEFKGIDLMKIYKKSDICFLELLHEIQNPKIIPYFDFWHYLIDREFIDAYRNSIYKFYFQQDPNDLPIFNKIREIYKIECSPYLKKEQNYINVYIDW